MKRKEVLEEAAKLITGDRAEHYGDAFENHARIAEGWNIIIRGAMMSHGLLTPAHVALMMDWVKTSRLLESLDMWTHGSTRQVTRPSEQNWRAQETRK